MKLDGSLPNSQAPATCHYPEPKDLSQSQALCDFQHRKFLRPAVVSASPNPQAGEPPSVGCPRVRILYVHSCPPYLEASSSVRNLSMGHVVVRGTHLTISLRPLFVLFIVLVLLYTY
jgi:hypothetical protein